jgi:hypothetical protein
MITLRNSESNALPQRETLRETVNGAFALLELGCRLEVGSHGV